MTTDPAMTMAHWNPYNAALLSAWVMCMLASVGMISLYLSHHSFHPVAKSFEHSSSLCDCFSSRIEFMEVIVLVQDLLPHGICVLEAFKAVLTDCNVESI